jgi:hypothetical protein
MRWGLARRTWRNFMGLPFGSRILVLAVIVSALIVLM